MNAKKLLGLSSCAIIGLAAVMLPSLSSAEAQRSGREQAFEELGFVSADGIVLRPGMTFANAAKDVSNAAQQEHSKWRTCMSGFDLGKAFTLSRGEFERYRRFPAQYCGPEPRGGSADSAETFFVREALYSISEGRRMGNVLARLSFSTGGEEVVPGSDRIGGRCLVLTNSAGKPIPVRSTRDSDPYTFANPYNKVDDPLLRYQSETQDLSNRLSNARAQLASLQNQLAGSRAWQGRQCVRPASGPIPPRPAAMSEAAITSAARGFCTDMSMRRIPKTQVVAALRSNYMDDYITAQSAWERGSKPQCAINIRSQVDDQMTLWVTRYGPTMGGYGMIQDNILQCERIARSSCSAPVSAWEERVRAIRAGPQAELNQCQNLASQISQSRSEIESLTPRLEQASANLAAAQAAPQQRPQAIPLSEARCR